MAAFVDKLPDLLHAQGGAVAALTPSVCVLAGAMAWSHRDPFNRLLAATALQENHLFVSADTVFDGVVPRAW